MYSESVHSSQFTVHSKLKTVNRSPGEALAKQGEPITVYRKGITLAELMIGGGIAAILIVILASFYITNFRIFGRQSIGIDLSNQAKIAVDDMTNWTRQSRAVARCPNTRCTPPIDPSSIILVLQLWPLDANGVPFDGGVSDSNFDYIIYQQDAQNKLVRKIVPSANPPSTRKAETNKILATDVLNLSFTWSPNPSDPLTATQVTISLTLQKTYLGKAVTASEEKQALIRNK